MAALRDRRSVLKRGSALLAIARALSTRIIVALIAIASVTAGLIVGLVPRHSPLERARALVEAGKQEEADPIYFDLVDQEPDNVPLLLEFIANHDGDDEDDSDGSDSSAPKREPQESDARVDALVARLPPDGALLAGYWDHVLRNTATESETARVLAVASQEPPMAWANDLLGRQARRSGDRKTAAWRFAREAEEFDDREPDASLACDIWVTTRDWASADDALKSARFKGQLSAGDRLTLATQRGKWTQMLALIVPAQLDGLTLAIVLLTTLSAAVWFWICSGIGSFLPAAQRLPPHVAAFGLGVASGYVALAMFLVETYFFPVLGGRSTSAEILDSLVGVGPREELAKGLFTLPVLLWVRRWGRRGDALTCGAFVGLGFAAGENLGYFQSGLDTALVRFLTANLFHIALTGLVAAAIDDLLRGRSAKGDNLGWTFAFVAVMHGVYDALVSFVPAHGVAVTPLFILFPFLLVIGSFLRNVWELPRRDGRLRDRFVVGMTAIAGASFVYACAQVGPKEAATAIGQGLFAVAILFFVGVDALDRNRA